MISKNRFMKLPTVGFLAMISIWAMISSCSEAACGSTAKGAKMADILVNAYDVSFNDDVSENPYYEVGITVLNSILGVNCPEEVESAGPHDNKLTMLYDDNPQFSSPETVGEEEVSILTETMADGTYTFDNEISFTKDGYYTLGYGLDDHNAIQERDEANNEGDILATSTGGRVQRIRYSKRYIFHVRHDQLARKENGEFCEFYNHWKITVR